MFMKKMTLKERMACAMAGPPKVTGSELARLTGLHASSVSDWITGKSKSIKPEHVAKVARVLNVLPAWLSLGDGPMRPGEEVPNVPAEPRTRAGQLDPSMVAETYRALRLHAERRGRVFDLDTLEGAQAFAYWYEVRAALPDSLTLGKVIEIDSRRG